MVYETIDDETLKDFMEVMERAIANKRWLGGLSKVEDIGLKRGYPLKFDVIKIMNVGKVTEQKSVSDIVFDADFARAVWGEDLVTIGTAKREVTEGQLVSKDDVGELRQVPAYKFHLARVATAETDGDRIKYVVENS